MLVFMKRRPSVACFLGAWHTFPHYTRLCNLLWQVQQAWLFRQSLFFALFPVFFPQRIVHVKEERKTSEETPLSSPRRVWSRLKTETA